MPFTHLFYAARLVVVFGLFAISAPGFLAQTLLADSADVDALGCQMWAPNSFTPDFDGLNDAWRPVVSCELEEYDLQIFDRWGTMVWRTDDPNRWWNGGVENDQLGTGSRFSPDGHYSFIITYRDPESVFRSVLRKTGYIWLSR